MRQTRAIPNSGGEARLSCGRIQQNAIKDTFFFYCSVLQATWEKYCRLSINEFLCLILVLNDAFSTGPDSETEETSLQPPQPGAGSRGLRRAFR